MDKTININLGGILFQIDEDAFRILRDYLDAINNRFRNLKDGHETIEDIESRIAEIFQSQKGNAGVITKENVESMIGIIGKPEDFDQMEGDPATGQRFNTKNRMYRNTDDMILGGVCSGIATYLNSEPVLFRVLFVIFTFFFGAGLIIYLGLWIALPAARTGSQKRELQGGTYSLSSTPNSNASSPVGNAINEIFRALGKIFYVVLRILLIIIGVSFVITGFLSIFSYVMIFVYPGIWSFGAEGLNLTNFPDFLRYVVNPASVPWIMILATIAFILPMMALIYWGVKMIFWFRARDGVVSLIAFLVWIAAVAALSIIGFSEGVSFAQTAKLSSETYLKNNPDTLIISSKNRVDNLKYKSIISIPDDEYKVFINDERKELYIRTYMQVDRSEDGKTHIELRKRSTGRTHLEAENKVEALIYNYSLSRDTLFADEYFTLPSGRRWSADDARLHLYLPDGMILKFEEPTRMMIRNWSVSDDDRWISRWAICSGIWKMNGGELEPLYKK